MEEFLQLPEIDNVLPDFVDRKSENAESISSQTNSVDESVVNTLK